MSGLSEQQVHFVGKKGRVRQKKRPAGDAVNDLGWSKNL